MIGISTTTSGETILIDEKPDQTEIKRLSPRVGRTATLDGGAVLTHSGTTWADTTFTVKADLTEAQEIILQAMIEDYALFYLACEAGFFSGAVDSYQADGGELNMSFLVKEKLSN